MTVRHLTRSSQLVGILNHLGHGLPNSQIQEVETSMASRHLVDSEDGTVYTPNNIQPNVPVITCWDNNDINEETISGHGTTHCTNGIIIQRGGQQAAPVLPSSSLKGKRKRSFTPRPCKILPYNARKRSGPGNMFITERDLSLQETACINQSKQKDIAWCLPQSRNDPEGRANTQQLVPGWSGFNAVISTDIPSLCTVCYCPVIEVSPTELSTVYTLLKRSVEMGQQLGHEEVIIVMDLAVYAKVQ